MPEAHALKALANPCSLVSKLRLTSLHDYLRDYATTTYTTTSARPPTEQRFRLEKSGAPSLYALCR